MKVCSACKVNIIKDFVCIEKDGGKYVMHEKH